VVAEALACGLPVAIADPVNISTEVAAAGAGLVHADTEAGVITALRQWLQLSAQDKQSMINNCFYLFDEKFNFASTSRRLLGILTSLAAEAKF